ncbi:hypothetical protein ACFXI8_27325 [Streptomyces niveus]|uniref:hypothetical protein n=1 Tax=Streptomyces niveus TaxID=193462 RepID=UPI0036A31396
MPSLDETPTPTPTPTPDASGSLPQITAGADHETHEHLDVAGLTTEAAEVKQ